MDKPLLIFKKTAEKTHNKIIVPKACIQKFGRDFYMEVYDDKIVMKPIKKGG